MEINNMKNEKGFRVEQIATSMNDKYSGDKL